MPKQTKQVKAYDNTAGGFIISVPHLGLWAHHKVFGKCNNTRSSKLRGITAFLSADNVTELKENTIRWKKKLHTTFSWSAKAYPPLHTDCKGHHQCMQIHTDRHTSFRASFREKPRCATTRNRIHNLRRAKEV